MEHILTSASNRILVVEDDALVRELIVEILADAGYAMSEVSCADEALDLFCRQPDLAAKIAVVVTDIDMPGEIDGLGLAARLAAAWPQIGVVVTSGARRAETRTLRQPSVFLAKPFRPDRLVAAVSSVIVAGARHERHAC
ncbi:response regulator [Methylovirgula sp. HY1]|uniref:response regulator n=1 Tax=Methylovirgula sp. HY1 TaxID=2822761 RepID=UPI001C5B0883|nr:response regulator [Methylovirgula sp. HY1]QXX73581.1 Response regulator receiver protein CpdR [Methylovirgula sp. HY1]